MCIHAKCTKFCEGAYHAAILVNTLIRGLEFSAKTMCNEIKIKNDHPIATASYAMKI